MFAQEEAAIVSLLGAGDVEEVDSYEYERLSGYLETPLEINSVSMSRLVESGLFSKYQAVSLNDYRVRHGDVLSLMELSAVDGFGEEYVVLLAPFISLKGGKLPGGGKSRRIKNALTLRSAGKTNVETAEEVLYNYALKYAFEAGESLSADFALARSYSAERASPDYLTGSMVISPGRLDGKIVIGDFNARFGQGLALWSGSNFGGSGTPATLAKRPGGFSRCRSFTGSTALTGVAADVSIGKLCLSSFVACPGIKEGESELMPAANLSYFGRFGQVSATHYACFSGVFSDEETRIPDMKTSLDASACLRGTDIFGEASFDWVSRSVAVIVGTAFPCGDNLRFASMLRYYPSEYADTYSAARCSTTKCANEYAVLCCGEFGAGEWIKLNGKEGFGASMRRHSGNFSLDCACFPEPKGKDVGNYSTQYKLMAEWNFLISDALMMKLRLSERMRSWGERFRTDVRADISWIGKTFGMNARLNLLKCADAGLLGYVEGTYKNNEIAFYLRQGLFCIDDWDDRIYVYERDAPGSFNVPAYYGRGQWSAFVVSWRFASWGKAYMRVSYLSYPFMEAEKKKPGRAELKLQCVFSL